MDLSDGGAVVNLLCGITIMVGILGVIVPVLPGLVLCWAGVLVWVLVSDADDGRWLVLAVTTLIAVGGTIVKYAWPGRNLKRTGVPSASIVIGGLLGIAGFFLVPVIGLVLGFVLGVWLSEWARLGDARAAWPSTWLALRAVGLALLIELAAALGIFGVWLLGLVLT
jgi:uncharacterized protein YqgC (DUF456 family)